MNLEHDGDRYRLLRVAHDRFGREPAGLAAAQRDEAERIVARQRQIETAVLASPEARGVVIPDAQVEQALASIAERYEDGDALQQALEANGLNDQLLRRMIARELAVEAILERVAASLPALGDTEPSLYYFNHPEQFERPETRKARHILITINPDFPENTRGAARARLEAIAKRLRSKPDRFAEQALKHSECPTALNGGELGQVARGTLYSVLEEALFALEEGELSGLVESPLGLHLLCCDAIAPARRVSLEEALPQLRERLQQRQRKAYQRQWLERLLHSNPSVEKAHG